MTNGRDAGLGISSAHERVPQSKPPSVPKIRSLARSVGAGTLYAWLLNASVQVANPIAIANSKSIYRARQRRALDATVSYIENNMADVPSWSDKRKLLAYAFSQADVSDGRLICEFGVYRAKSLNYLASLTDCEVFGFDAFQGLPSGYSDHWKEGDFQVNALPKVRSNVRLIDGWFDATLPDFLSQHSEPAGFIHIDCDLYDRAH